MLILQIPLVLGTAVGLLLLLKNQHLLGPARSSALIGITALLLLSLLGPFYQAWITQMAMRSGGGSGSFLVAGLLINALWAISIILLVISIFVGRGSNR